MSVSTLVYTNKLRGCPFRGLGIPEAVWAGESQMDIISAKLGIDPVELRLKNCLETGDETPAGDRANHIALRECLLKVSAELQRWRKRAPAESRLRPRVAAQIADDFGLVFQRQRAHRRRTAKWNCKSAPPTSAAVPERASARSSPRNWPYRSATVRVVIADTELTPFDHGTYSSRVTPYVGAAVKLAADRCPPANVGESSATLAFAD